MTHVPFRHRQGISEQIIMSDNNKKQTTIEKQIDENLRRVYEQAVQEDIPERLLQLLAQLKAQDKPK